MLYLLIVLFIGGAVGYLYAQKFGSSLVVPMVIGAAGALLGWLILKALLPALLAVVLAALGAAALLAVYRMKR